MKELRRSHTRERLELVRWTARVGVVTEDSLARLEGVSVASARGRLLAAERAELLAGCRPLHETPALYVVTATGAREAGARGIEPTRVSAANARHLAACAEAAAAMARAYGGDHAVSGERELRRDERAYGGPLASATIGASGRPQLHRPDLVLWPRERGRLPVAVEVELTVKAPRRLSEICVAWARCRCVSGVLYLASPEAERALARAIAHAQAGGRVRLLGLGGLLAGAEADERRRESLVTGGA